MNPLAGHTGSYYSYSTDEALAGIAAAGFRHVELSAVPGNTDHVDGGSDPADIRAKLEYHGLQVLSVSGHSNLTTPEGLEYGLSVVRWAERFGVPIVNTAVGGHAPDVDESEAAFLANVRQLADAAQDGGIPNA